MGREETNSSFAQYFPFPCRSTGQRNSARLFRYCLALKENRLLLASSLPVERDLTLNNMHSDSTISLSLTPPSQQWRGCQRATFKWNFSIYPHKCTKSIRARDELKLPFKKKKKAATAAWYRKVLGISAIPRVHNRHEAPSVLATRELTCKVLLTAKGSSVYSSQYIEMASFPFIIFYLHRDACNFLNVRLKKKRK